MAGLVPRASRIEDPDLARAVREREDAIAKRALDLAEHAVRSGVPWAKAFGPPPPRPAVAQAWWDRLAVVAAYRDRWRITADTEHPRRGEGCRLALPSRTPRPGAAGRAGSCSLGRPGSADGSPGARVACAHGPKPRSSCEPAGDGRQRLKIVAAATLGGGTGLRPPPILLKKRKTGTSAAVLRPRLCPHNLSCSGRLEKAHNADSASTTLKGDRGSCSVCPLLALAT